MLITRYTKQLFLTIIFICITNFAQNFSLIEKNFKAVGRGKITWNNESVIIKDCFITHKADSPNNFEITFSAKSPVSEEQVQIWSGFGFADRNNRYSLGLRGGNNNDIYLCRYQSKAKNKMIAIESLDFNPQPGEEYKLKVAFWEGNIRVYLNNEIRPRLITYDQDYLKGGSAILGGGWIKTEYSNFEIRELTATDIERYSKDTVNIITKLTKAEKENIRIKQRSNYQSYKVSELADSRNEFSLNGKWLFMPDNNIADNSLPYSLDVDDNRWHIMPVPNFWNTVRNWLHLQDSGFPHKGSGLSDNYREKEEERCESYTFDSKNTSAAWYRHWLNITKIVKGNKYTIHFDAVAKLADLYVNGKYVGGHVGMFGKFDFDITDYLKQGDNLIALSVKVRKTEKTQDADKNVARAVSVDITNDMLNSLPNGMFGGDEGGIWQDVKLIVTDQTYIKDVFANVEAEGGSIEIEVKNNSKVNDNINVKIEITDKITNEILFSSQAEKPVNSNELRIFNIKTGEINPKLWSPENPNLYTLNTYLYRENKLIDNTATTIGFRTFKIVGNKFYLNGNPYWLRGANHPPCGIAPNDVELANNFYKLMHEGNQMITRSHGSPFTKAWMDASDKQGVGVSYEGSWPWLMISNIPSEELLDVWREETISLVKKYRNHPSLLIWTINNEMYFPMFYHNDPHNVKMKKWEILSDVIKEIRKLSPNTAISGDSGYSRLPIDYETNLKPNNIDDGDIDDRHVYFNWYNRDFYQVYDGEWAKRIYWSPGANTDRPFFSQETSTGYTNNDNGHYNRKYLFNNYVPQAWVGDWAYEDKDPKFTLERHAFMSKELYEVIRRTSPETAGVLLFANVTWFRNVFDSQKISPYPIYDKFNLAANPVLVTAELFGRNFYTGTTINPKICIVNNAIDGSDIPAVNLEWKVTHKKKVLTKGIIKTDRVPHYDRLWLKSKINLPNFLPENKSYCKLELILKTGSDVVSHNEYDIIIANNNWLSLNEINSKNIHVFDITGNTYTVLDKLGIKYNKLNDLTEMRYSNSDLFIIANLDAKEEVPYSWEDVSKVCGNGTNVLLIHPGKHLQWLYYNKIASIYERKGRVVNMHIPEHKAYEGIAPMELSWWQQKGREKPRACRRSFRLKNSEGITSLATYLRPHTGLGSDRESYLEEMSGIPLMEIKEKKGRMIASEMELNMADRDPVAGKMLINIISYLLN